MILFEMKKVFSKSRNRLAVLFLLVILIIISILTINQVEYVDKDGNSSTGIAAARNLRTEKNKWAGYVTEDVMKKMLEKNKAVINSEEASSDDIQEQNKAYAKQQGFLAIRDLLNNAFSDWKDYDYYVADGLTAEDLKHVYENRILGFRKWLETGEEHFSDAEKDYIIQKFEELKTPFYYEYYDGWDALLQNIETFLLILALFIGFFVSGIFSEEYQQKADSIFFSTKLGRNKAIRSKMGAGFLITTVGYAVGVFIYTMIVLLVLGFDGAGCPIQFDLWRSVYNITFFEAYLMIVIGGYVGTLFAATFSMLVSAKTHSTAIALVVPFIILCVFPFLSRIITLPNVCAFFPDQLLEVYIDIRELVLCEIGGKVMDVVSVIIPVYAAACFIIQPIIYGVYKRVEVK